MVYTTYMYTQQRVLYYHFQGMRPNQISKGLPPQGEELAIYLINMQPQEQLLILLGLVELQNYNRNEKNR